MIKVYWNFRAALAWALAAAAFAAFATTNHQFANSGNLYALLQSFSVLAVVSAGLGLVMIAGEFDLSIAGVLPLTALLTVRIGEAVNPLIGIAAAVAVGAGFGALNGWLTARFAVPSLAITVGTLVLTTGIGFAIAGGDVVTLTDYGLGLWLDQPLAQLLSVHSVVQILLAVSAALLMAKTWHGLAIYSVGSDPQRSAASGLSVTRSLVLVFVLSGLFAGVAGSLQGVTLAAGTPGADQGVLLQAATAAIIGGIALSGGKGSIVGVIAGALLLAIVGNGLSLQGASTAVVQLINGALLLVVVTVDGPLTRAIRRSVQNASSHINTSPIHNS